MNYKYLFGPVQSRRLGISLGVDMIPFKTCNCNCIYCECGATKPVANERKPYIAAHDLIHELDHYLGTQPTLNFVTFAGSGEPTLNTALGEVLRFVKTNYTAYSTALLTNGILLGRSDVQREVASFDLICPSLDAVSEEVFNLINRPFPGVRSSQMVEGLAEFSKIYKGQLWVEVFIVPGINDTSEELTLLKTALQTINPTRVQLNSLDRPGPYSWVQPASPQQLASIAVSLQPLPVEIISRHAAAVLSSEIPVGYIDSAIHDQLKRRPATVEEIAVLCGTTINEAKTAVNSLIEEGSVTGSSVANRIFYSLTGSNQDISQ